MFGTALIPLEPRNDEAGRRRPALTSPKRATILREAPPHWSRLVSRVAPAVSGPAGFPSLAFAALESFTSERAAARPALTSPKRAAVTRVAPAAEEPVSFPKWPPPHRGPLGLPHSASGRGASSITLYAVDRVTSLKIVQVSLGVVIPAFGTLLAQSRSG